MKHSLTAFFSMIMLLTLSFTSSAVEYAGVSIPETLSHEGTTMQLNGSGLRKKVFIKLYVGSLYLTEKSNDAAKIIEDDSAMAIRLAVKSSLISPKKMKEATLEGFEKSTGGNIEAIKPQIDMLLASFDKGVGVGDIYEMINVSGSGVDVLRNGDKVASIPSIEFKKALFGIWLSDHPVQENLKKGMLGK